MTNEKKKENRLILFNKTNKNIIWVLILIYFVVSSIILINDYGKGKRFSETLNTITLGLLGQSQEDIIREIGGERAVQQMKAMKKFAKECQPILESLTEEQRKTCLRVLEILKK